MGSDPLYLHHRRQRPVRCAVRADGLPGAHNGDRRIRLRCKKSPVPAHRGFFISGIQWAVPTFTGDYLL